MKPAIYCLLLAFSLPAHAVDFDVETGNLSAPEKRAAAMLIKAVSEKLPASMREALSDETISVRWDNLAEKYAGHARGSRIILNKAYLKEVLKGPMNSATPAKFYRNEKVALRHPTMYHLAVGSMIHEVAHVYDRLNIQPDDELSAIKRCQWGRRPKFDHGDGESFKGTKAECRLYAKRRTTVSSNPDFLNAADFSETGFLRRKRKQVNVLSSRSPDPYEFKNPSESFAVNLEYFLLDEQYACRRPVLARFFTRHFGQNPHAGVKCNTTNTVLLTGSAFAGTSARMVELDFSRLYEIHYLYAGKGPRLMSKYGHAMIRLVFCAPTRAKPGPECRQDLQEHVVLSYRGAVEDFTMNVLDGLTGKFHSMLFMLPLVNVLDQYSRGEMREVFSVPLKLTRTELRSFYDAALEAHWAYEGKYFFLSNNCATETMNLIKKALSYTKHRTYHSAYIHRPDTLLKLLYASGLSDQRHFNNLKKAEETFLYFKPRRPFYEEQLARLKKSYNSALARHDLDAFLEKTKAGQRRQLADRIIADKNKKGAAAMLILEGLILQRTQRDLFSSIIKTYTKRLRQEDQQAVRLERDMQYMKEMIRLTASPARMLPTQSYGIPAKHESDLITQDAELKVKFDKAQELGPQVESELRKWVDPAQVQNLNTIIETRKRLRNYLVKTVKDMAVAPAATAAPSP